MRLTSILLLTFSLHLSASTHAQRITLSLKQTPLKQVFEKITAQTGFQFIYRDEWLPQTKPVNITVRDASIQQVLDTCFNGQPFTYDIIDKMVVLKERDLPVSMAPANVSPLVLIDVHGRITDANGKPLAGVTILAKAERSVPGRFIRVLTVDSVREHKLALADSTQVLKRSTLTTVPTSITPAGGVTPQVSTLSPVTTASGTDLRPNITAAKPAGKFSTDSVATISANDATVTAVAVTDANGEFVLKQVPDEAVLYISHIGYESQQIKLDKQHELSIQLKLKADELKNVEVTYSTGYQVLSQERATGSFGKPDMQVFEQRVGTMDLVSRLEGLVAGVTVLGVNANQVAGVGNLGPTNTQKTATIRGSSSISLSTVPLYVVNGTIVPDFTSLNIDDVADITVLKDAAAAAIWGAKAANGVIVITTKSGLKGQKIKFNYSSFINYQGRPDFSYFHMLNSPQYIQAAKETFDPVVNPWSNLYNQVITPHEQILYDHYRGLITDAQETTSLDSLAALNNSQQIKDLYFRNAFTTNHTLSATGGSNVYSFYASMGYTDVQSFRPGETNNTFKVNLTQNLNAGKNVSLSMTANLLDNITSGEGYSQGSSSFDNTFLPYQLFENAAGQHVNMPYIVGYSDSLRRNYQARSRINLDYTPLDEVGLLQTKGNGLNMNVTLNAGVKLWKGLSYQGTYGYLTAPGTSSYYDDGQSLDQRKQELQLTVAPTTASTPVYYYPTTGGLYQTTTSSQRNWTVRNQLVYSMPLRRLDQLSLQVGEEAQEQFSSGATTAIPGYNQTLNTFPLIDYSKLSQGIPGTVTSSSGGFFVSSAYYFGTPYSYSEARTRTKSYFALGSYTLNGKYSVDLSWRQDHSNLFGHDVSTQNKPIWSLGSKWRLSKESFLLPVKAINDLSLRATYGITGNSPYVGAATLYDILTAQAGSTPGALSGDAAYIQQAANNALAWETTQTLNIGVDYVLLDHRLSGSIDVYNKRTSNLLNTQPLNPLTGFQNSTGNLGTLNNKGIELNIHSTNIRSKNFTWTSSLLFSYNKNKLVAYGVPLALLNTVSVRLFNSYVAGYSRYPIFAYRYAGLDNMGDPQIMLNNKTVTKSTSVPQIQDLRYMGTALPPINGSFSNTVTYKSFSLTGNMIYNLGAVMRRYAIDNFYTGRLTLGRQGGGYTSLVNVPAEFADRWKQPGDEKKTNIPSYVSNPTTNALRRNTAYYTSGDINVVSASYIKLRDVTLSYNVNPRVLTAIKAQSLNLYVQTTNFMIWKANHYGIDPEFQNVIYLPFRHSYIFGANLSF